MARRQVSTVESGGKLKHRMAGTSGMGNAHAPPSNESVWHTISEKTFQQQIQALWTHSHGRPQDPVVYDIPKKKGVNENQLSLRAEIELAEGLAFIAAVRKGVETVSAVAVAIPKKNIDGIVFHVASNNEVSTQTRTSFQSITSVLEKMATADISLEEGKSRLFSLIVAMNASHINARLKTRKGGRPIVLEGLRQILNGLVKPKVKTKNLKSLENRLSDLCISLQAYAESSKPTPSIDQLKKLVIACYKFCAAPGDETTKDLLARAGIDVDDVRGNCHIRQVVKVASYHHIAETIANIVTNPKCSQLFRRIKLEFVSGFDPVSMQIPRKIAGGNTSCRVHAEVKLIIALDMIKSSKWHAPRTVGSSKAACFLCNSFMQHHGEYFVPRSHGILTPFWTIPDHANFDIQQRILYRKVVENMSKDLRKLIGTPYVHRVEPAMSWQAFSRLNLLHISHLSLQTQTSTPQVSLRVVAPAYDGVSGMQVMNPTTEMSPNLDGRPDSPCEQVQTLDHNELTIGERNGLNSETPSVDVKSDAGQLLLQVQARNTCSKTCSGNECLSTRYSPTNEQHQHTRPSIGVDDERQAAPVCTMPDHKGRADKGLRAHSASNVDAEIVSGTSHLPVVNRSQKFDFHDLELFVEFERPVLGTVSVLPGQAPLEALFPVVDVTKLHPCGETVVSFDVCDSDIRIMHLCLKDRSQDDQYYTLQWHQIGFVTEKHQSTNA